MGDFGLDSNDYADETWRNHFVDQRSEHNSWIRVEADSEFSAVSHLFAKSWLPVRNPDGLNPDSSYILDNKRLTPTQILELARFLAPIFGSAVEASKGLVRGKVAIPSHCVSEFQRV